MRANRRIRVGVIGLGFGQNVHVPAWRIDRRSDITALCGRNLQHTQLAAKNLTIPCAYDNWHEMVASPDVDAISIAVVPARQPEIALAALEAGKPVFCEKPLVTTQRQADEMVRRAQATNLANMVNYEFQESSVWRKAKSLLDSGAIGRVSHLAIVWSVRSQGKTADPSRTWKTDVSSGGGLLNTFGSHVLHYLQWFAGDISALSARLKNSDANESRSESLVMLQLEFASDAMATVTLCKQVNNANHHRIEIQGDQGSLVLENNDLDYVTGFTLTLQQKQSKRAIVINEDINREGDGRIPAVACLMKRFLDWVETDKKMTPDFSEGAKVQSLMNAARLSNANKSWVNLRETVPA